MSSDIKTKAINGTFWSSIERFSTQIVQFVITIIMARILTPEDYGLIGMLAIFISLSQVFIDGGFSSALIQRKDRNDADFSTVFYINIGVSAIIYLLLFALGPLIADFYHQPILCPIIRVYSLNLIINAFAAVTKTILIIKLDFKTQSKISFISAILSGICGIIAASFGLKVWALVIQALIMSVLNVILSFALVKWRPNAKFSKESFKKLFGFGSKLLVASIISSVYDNLYNLVIGKEFNAKDLGYFSKSKSFTSLISTNIGGILTSVSYPILSEVQSDKSHLLNIYRRYMQLSAFIIFPLLMLLCGIASPMVIFLLTDKWAGCIIILQILCFANLFSGLTAVNLNLLKVTGRSDLVLQIEVIKKIIAISILAVSMLFHNLEIICIGLVLYSFIAFYINTYYTNKILSYGYLKQLQDVLPYFLISLFILSISLFISYIITIPVVSLCISLFLCGSIYVLICKFFKLYGYITLTEIANKLYIKFK